MLPQVARGSRGPVISRAQINSRCSSVCFMPYQQRCQAYGGSTWVFVRTFLSGTSRCVISNDASSFTRGMLSRCWTRRLEPCAEAMSTSNSACQEASQELIGKLEGQAVSGSKGLTTRRPGKPTKFHIGGNITSETGSGVLSWTWRRKAWRKQRRVRRR